LRERIHYVFAFLVERNNMSALTENQIFDIVYSLYGGDDADGWAETDDEYLVARKYANDAITKWEFYDNTRWNELFTNLTAASDGDKTTTAGDWEYDCPSDMRFPASWVRTIGAASSAVTFWTVIKPEQSGKYADSTDKVCWFSGSFKDGYKLNFNPKATLTTSDTIKYEYYKQAATFAAAADTTEISDPYFIVYWVLQRFLKNDGEDNFEELQEADTRLEQMRVVNLSGYFGIGDTINEPIGMNSGFGV